MRIPHEPRLIGSRPARLLATGIATLLLHLPSHGATFTWNNVDGNWSDPLNWSGGVVPMSDPTNHLIFGGSGNTGYTSTNDFFGSLLLNRLTLESSATEMNTIIGFAPLEFTFDGLDLPSILQNGSGSFEISNELMASTLLNLGGTGQGVVRLSGTITGTGGLNFTGGNWEITNTGNSFTGGVTISTGARVELIAGIFDPSSISLEPAFASLLGGNSASNPLIIDGGTLKVTTVGSGFITVGSARPVTFGFNGGVLDLVNVNTSIPGIQGGNITSGDFSVTLNNDPSAPAVIRFNGGELGLRTNNPTDGNWGSGENALRISAYNGTGSLRVEITNGATFRLGTGSTSNQSIARAITIRGVTGGDPTSGPNGTLLAGTSLTTGRVVIDNANEHTYTNSLTLQGALQFTPVGTTRALNGNITIAGTASGSPGYVVFSGRGTNTQLTSTLNAPGTGSAGQNPLWLLRNGNGQLTIEDGGIAVLDARIREDTSGANGNGVVLDGLAVIQAGGTLRFQQSISNYTPGVPATTANVGDIIIRGDIRGEGNSSKDAVIEILLPQPQSGVDTFATTIPFALTTTETNTTTNLRPYGGLRFDDNSGTNADFIINGTGFGGLRIRALPRPTGLLQGGVLDPVSNTTKINSVLTPARLSRITGTGGYLTVTPEGETWSFPNGGEWANIVPVGLKVLNHNSSGVDVSLAALSSFSHNIVVTPGATLNVGAGPFTYGPSTPSAGLGRLEGTGTVTGNLTIAPGAVLAPGMPGIGTLTVGNITINGTLEMEVNSTPARDILVVNGDLVLNPSSTLQLPPTNTYNNGEYIIANYTGTLTGAFGVISGLPPTYTIDYGSGSNSSIRLFFQEIVERVWDGLVGGSPNGNWNTTNPNWQGANLFADGNRVTFDDTIAPTGSRNVVIDAANVAPQQITVNTSQSYSITGTAGHAIVGTGLLIKDGTGTLTLTGPHSYTGGTTINGGILRTGADNSLPDLGVITVAPGATLDLDGHTDTIGNLTSAGTVSTGNLTANQVTIAGGSTFAPNLVLNTGLAKTGSGSATIPGTINLNGGVRTIDVESGFGSELTLSGTVSNGGITKNGGGALILAVPNTYGGPTSVVEGTLTELVAGALPDNQEITVEESGFLDINGFNHTFTSLDSTGAVITNGGSLTLGRLSGTGGTLDLGAGNITVNQSANTSFTGSIFAGAFTKAGGGKLTLAGSNLFTGDVHVNGGTLELANAGAASVGVINVATGATLDMAASITNSVNVTNGTVTISGNRTFQGTLNVSGDVEISNRDPESPTANNNFIILGNGLQGSGNITVRGFENNTNVDGNSGVRFQSTVPSDFTGSITLLPASKLESQMAEGGANPLNTAKIFLTTGTFLPNQAGTFSQFNVRTAGGNPNFGNDIELLGTGLTNINPVNTAGISTDQTMTFNNLRIGDGQVLGVNKNGTPTHTIVFNSVTLKGGTATFSPTTAQFGYSGIAHLTLGPIEEDVPGSGVNLAPGSGARLLLAAPNSYTGPTTLPSSVQPPEALGTVHLGAEGALPPTTNLTVNSGVLDLSDGLGTSYNQTVASLAGSNGTISNNGFDELRTLTINQNVNSFFNGSIQGNLRILKKGTGTLQLGGFHSHFGGTAVEEGTLFISGNSGFSPVEVIGGTLSGTGFIGELTVRNQGFVAPGAGVGIFNTGSALFEQGARLSLDINGITPGIGHDQLVVNGALTLEGNVELQISLGFDPTDSIDSFLVLLNDGTDPKEGAGLFSYAGTPLGQGDRFTVSGAFTQTFEINYLGGDGNDIVLIAVPEPTSAILALVGGLTALAGIRRRRS